MASNRSSRHALVLRQAQDEVYWKGIIPKVDLMVSLSNHEGVASREELP
jgi:hypothetical protein